MLKGLRGITSKIPHENGLHIVHAVLPPERALLWLSLQEHHVLRFFVDWYLHQRYQ